MGPTEMGYQLMQKSLSPWHLLLWPWSFPRHPGLLVAQRRGNDIFTPSFAVITESRRMKSCRHFLSNFYKGVHVLIISICTHVSAGISVALH